MNIFEAIKENNIMRIRKILKDKSFNINKASEYGSTQLHLVCDSNNLDIVTLLLDYACREFDESSAKEFINKANKFGTTPLYLACWHNNQKIVELLLNKGAQESINKADEYGDTPLLWACQNNNLDIVTLLLDYACRKLDESSVKEFVNKVDNIYGRTPLLLACKKNNLKIVELLLANGAKESINIADNEGDTPLYWACDNNNLDIVKLLLENGAYIDKEALSIAAIIANNDCRTPLYLALNNKEILELLTLSQNLDRSINKRKFIENQSDPAIVNTLYKRFYSIDRINAKDTIKQFVSCITEKVEEKINGRLCSICLENCLNTEENGMEVELKCKGKHKFHENCINNWFSEHDSCPECREQIIN